MASGIAQGCIHTTSMATPTVGYGDGVAQYGGHTAYNRLTGTCSLGLQCTVYLKLDIRFMVNYCQYTWPNDKLASLKCTFLQAKQEGMG